MMQAIEPRTFDGLTLQHLFVNGNRNVRIHDESFAGLATTGLYIHDCSLRHIRPESIVRLNFTLRYYIEFFVCPFEKMQHHSLYRVSRPY